MIYKEHILLGVFAHPHKYVEHKRCTRQYRTELFVFNSHVSCYSLFPGSLGYYSFSKKLSLLPNKKCRLLFASTGNKLRILSTQATRLTKN